MASRKKKPVDGDTAPAGQADPATEFNPAELESLPPTAAMTPVGEPAQPVIPKIGTALPDPHGIDLIALSAERDGPRMHLLRSRRHRDVWIAFDVNPGKEITDQIKAEGFRWERQAELPSGNAGAWVKPLEPGREIRIMLDAERLFLKLGNDIRQSKGLEPVGQVGVGAD
jgi:hypothetical protein